MFLRGRALRSQLDAAGLRRLFAADNVSGVAAALWLVTGVVRAFAGLDVTSAFETIEALNGKAARTLAGLRARASRGVCRLQPRDQVRAG